MKKRILSIVSASLLVCSMFCSSIVNVGAEEATNRQVDDSYLTMEETATDQTEYNPLLRGEHLMDGTVTISKAGVKKIFVYGATTANHDVDHVSVDVYVDEYNPEAEYWEQIDWMNADAENTYYAVTQKTVWVDGGHYYRVRGEHFAWNDGETLVDESVTVTDGIWVD